MDEKSNVNKPVLILFVMMLMVAVGIGLLFWYLTEYKPQQLNNNMQIENSNKVGE